MSKSRELLTLLAQGAVAEAAFMTGIERNSEVVQMAAYAPLLANVNHKGALCPTNLIIYDNHRCGGTPSLSPTSSKLLCLCSENMRLIRFTFYISSQS